MPCCNREGGSTKYCQRCLELLCLHSPMGNTGRCPTCRSFFIIEEGAVQNFLPTGTCRMCQQGGKVLVDRNFCDACALGDRYAFAYQCSRCTRVQVIPHPVWRYQPSPTAYGASSWACHVGCGDYTHWRIVPDDVVRIPAQEVPESWGQRDEWLELIRASRTAEHQQR
ncbi:hypothetical protein B484DRAFT_311880, partial [Ochromonadaceae sp. CCMP2298]